MTVNALLVVSAGAVFGLGVWLSVTAIRGVRLLPEARRLVPMAVTAERAALWLSLAVAAGLIPLNYF